MNLERDKTKESRGVENTKWNWWNSGKGNAMSSLCTGLNSGVLPLSRPTKGVGRPVAGPNFSLLFSVIHNDCHMVQNCMNERRGSPVQA